MSRLYSHLRIVGGTEFKSAGQEDLSTSVQIEDAISAKARHSKPPEEMDSVRERASVLIRQLPVEGAATVGDLFDEMNDNLLKYKHASVDDPYVGDILVRHSIIREKLRAAGIWTVIADPELELACEVYGQVYDPRKTLRRIPQLRKYEAVLPGLTL